MDDRTPHHPARPSGALRRLRGRAGRERLGERADEGVALLMVIMIILVASGLSLLLLASVVNSVKPTLAARKHIRTLHAAEAGMNVVLSQIRVATQIDPLDVTQTIGDKTKLPCTTTATPITGQVGGEQGNVTYTVQVRYYREDPAGKTDAWRSSSANVITCGASMSEQPKYALITAIGGGDRLPNVALATSGDRTAEIVYSFKTDNTNAIGGKIYMNGKCFDANTATPASGANVSLVTCDSNDVGQKFYWRDDLTIVLSSTLSTTPMCVTADPTGSTTDVTQMYPCDGQIHQVWGLDDSSPPYLYRTGGYYACDNGSGYLVAGTGCSNTIDIDQSVGSGRAGYPPSTVPNTSAATDTPLQWVNYARYGRCIDINSWNITRDVILWPCKQQPDTATLRWNQGIAWRMLNTTTRKSYLVSYYGSGGQDFSVAKGNAAQQICLRSDVTGAALRFYNCSSTEPRQQWIVNRDKDAAGNDLSYDVAYTIVDNNGNCLDVGPSTATAVGLDTLRVMACTGGESQKWNAPPTFNKAKQKDFQETTGS